MKVNNLNFKNVSCDFCRSKNHRILFAKVKDYNLDKPGIFNIVECLNCGLVFLNPRPDKKLVASYYPFEYKPYSVEKEKILIKWTKEKLIQKDIQKVKSLIGKNGKILEIGCATGEFLNQLKKHGEWSIYGVDMDKKSIEYARNIYRLNVKVANIEKMDFEKNGFDLVLMKHVLEHLSSPQDTFKKLSRIIKKNGYLIIWIPNIDSLERKIFGKYWSGFDIPRHFYDFNKDSLKKYFNQSNFKIEEIQYSFIPNDWINSTRNMLKDHRLFFLAKIFNLKNIFLLIFFLPVGLFCGIFKKSGRLKIIVKNIKY